MISTKTIRFTQQSLEAHSRGLGSKSCANDALALFPATPSVCQPSTMCHATLALLQLKVSIVKSPSNGAVALGDGYLGSLLDLAGRLIFGNEL